MDTELGQDDSHLGAGRRRRSGYGLERKRAVHLPQASVGAGCTVVIKPSELSSLQTQVMIECVIAAKLPKGVCNVVIGRGDVVGAELVHNPDVDKISFTGSVGVGEGIMRDGAATMKRVTLELGGKSPTILLDDAALDRAIPRLSCWPS